MKLVHIVSEEDGKDINATTKRKSSQMNLEGGAAGDWNFVKFYSEQSQYFLPSMPRAKVSCSPPSTT